MMKAGDRVSYLNQEGGGIIQSISQFTALVEDDEGFTYEMDLEELMLLTETSELQNIEIPDTLSKESKQPSSKPMKTSPTTTEIDLHFGHLVDYPNQYTAHEKLQIQLQTAQEALHRAVGSGNTLILIHGKGNGVLEQKVYSLLENTPKIRYKEADFKRYKLGAVEITFI